MNGAVFISQNPLISDIEIFPAETPTVVGRSIMSDISVPDVLMSRRHCEFQIVEERVIVRDLQSTNGTIVNGELVADSVLNEGDVLILGQSEFTTEFRRSAK
ncbi:MAG: FHA domain-containing protein [Planctomycetota bacterium]|nr:FHA domain-containing protein [Planctomycetota bacterium]